MLLLDYGLGLDVEFSLGEDETSIPETPGTSTTWEYLRRQTTVDELKPEAVWEYVRREITFYKDYKMANRDPFVVSKGGKLVNQKIFLNPLRVTNDTLLSDGAIVPSMDVAGFTFENVRRNTVARVNEDLITFPVNTVIEFDLVAPSGEVNYNTTLLYFEFESTAGLKLKISHPVALVDAIEAR